LQVVEVTTKHWECPYCKSEFRAKTDATACLLKCESKHCKEFAKAYSGLSWIGENSDNRIVRILKGWSSKGNEYKIHSIPLKGAGKWDEGELIAGDTISHDQFVEELKKYNNSSLPTCKYECDNITEATRFAVSQVIDFKQKRLEALQRVIENAGLFKEV